MNKEQLFSILKGAAVAAAGAFLAYLTQFFQAPVIGGFADSPDAFGNGILLTTLLSIAVNALRKWLLG